MKELGGRRIKDGSRHFVSQASCQKEDRVWRFRFGTYNRTDVRAGFGLA